MQVEFNLWVPLLHIGTIVLERFEYEMNLEKYPKMFPEVKGVAKLDNWLEHLQKMQKVPAKANNYLNVTRKYFPTCVISM